MTFSLGWWQLCQTRRMWQHIYIFFYHLWWALGSRVLSLIQFVPALHQLNNDGPAEVHQLETRHVGPAMHEPLQRYVLKTLKAGTERRKDDVRMRVEEKHIPA